MNLADQVLADLDAELSASGEDIVLRRVTLGPAGVQIPFDAAVRAFVRGYAPNELLDGIAQQDSKVILSPTQLSRAGWPGPGQSPVPKKGDKAVIAGKLRNIEAAAGIHFGETLVRIELRVLG